MSESKNHQIMHAQIDWSDQSEPFSPLFDDLYFNTDQGIEESRYVFLEGNQLIERWSDWQSDTFCIAETGFGTGLNFLLTCWLFDEFLKSNAQSTLQHLIFSSFEKYPLKQQDLQLALQKWPILAAYIQPLLAQYPLPLVGCHRLHFDNITLDLWFGDVQALLPNLYVHQQGLFDCWYLDGFAPSKNPDMWNEQLFHCIAKSCKQNATLATFTAAGFVKRGLQAAGFNMAKRKGYGKKREMLIGKIPQQLPSKQYAQHFRACKSKNANKEVAIIGGGISSACLTLALLKRGYKVTLYCKDAELGCAASGNNQGALYPLINKQHDALSQLFTNSFLYARNYVQHINQTDPFDFDFSGLLQLYYDDTAGSKLDKMLQAGLPSTLVKKVDRTETDNLANLDIGQEALFYSQAGWLSPKQMVTSLFAKASRSEHFTLKLKHTLTKFEKKDSGWLCEFDEYQSEHELLILTTAMHTLDFAQCAALPLSAARGQVSHIDTNSQLQQLTLTLCHEGYLTPYSNGAHCMGATFKRHTMDDSFSALEQIENKGKLTKCIKHKNWVEKIETNHNHAHVGIRCTTRDHFPYMGNIPDYQQSKHLYKNAQTAMPIDNAPHHENLFILTGLGSRGLNTAPLLAEALASQINAEPIPLNVPILNALQCNRQWINYLKKGKALKF